MKQHSLSINYKNSFINYQFSIILLTAVLCAFPVKAQVVIGTNSGSPHGYSLMEIISAQDKPGGLRMAQLSDDQIDGANGLTAQLQNLSSTDAVTAKGLVVFNTDTKCLQIWNGDKWISLCANAGNCSAIVFPIPASTYTLCTGATFSDLTASTGGKVLWYNAATGGTAHADTETLTTGATYYAEECVDICVSPTRYPVTVTLGDCTAAPGISNITTYTNVMYDFQHQTLEAYYSGGIPTKYQWQVSKDNVTFNDIQGAPNSNFYTVPAHFADSYFPATDNADSLFFHCILSNSRGNSTTNNSLNILFINTGTSGYGIDENGVRYLTIQKGANGNKDGATTSGRMKIALLNLGQSQNFDGSYNNDAGDLGDFYQWGRVADGHQKTVWSKNASHVNIIDPMSGTLNTTSLPVPTGSQSYDINGQIKNDGLGYYGNFITTSSSPYDWNKSVNNLWGDGSSSNSDPRISDIALSLWTYANNPCRGNWSVPSSWNMWDIYNGTGSDTSPTPTNYTGTVNKWVWHNNSANVIGGVIITNKDGEKVFLPAAGNRGYGSGSLSLVGTNGDYWDSSAASSNNASSLVFTNTSVDTGGANSRGFGYSVRCVAP